MKEKDFDAQASYDHWIVKEVDDRGELIHIRFVEYGGMKTEALLKKNGYVEVFSGINAVGYELPGYTQVLVKKDLSSEGPEGTIIATKTKEVFDANGKKLGTIWDMEHCAVGGMEYSIVQVGGENYRWQKVIWLENKYVEFYEKLKEIRWNKSYKTKTTYHKLREIVDGGKAEEALKSAENPKGEMPF